MLNPEQYKQKTKNISLVSSNKCWCDLHKFRYDLANHYKNSPVVDTYGTFDGGKLIKISEALEYYRYSIVIENDITPYRFTEKILDCFASMTVPIYVGATKISDFFNIDGIITVPDLCIEAIDKIISECTIENYEMRIPALLDNYKRVQEYLCIVDYIYAHYKQYFV